MRQLGAFRYSIKMAGAGQYQIASTSFEYRQLLITLEKKIGTFRPIF
ncbi:hypothetical protein KUC_0910 [Vreelandella boliviensis LC1]|uniref:Uncharacterized protein n=1 Tax=Vreelandella boliviensis LC1 TaxID=1072583 RepID=A0A7U9C6C8_9GAMM|nr:hypothetical protein KUC_0910 [Halomonas boliviensis LC1]